MNDLAYQRPVVTNPPPKLPMRTRAVVKLARDSWWIRLLSLIWPKQRPVVGTTYLPTQGAVTLRGGDLYIILKGVERESERERR